MHSFHWTDNRPSKSICDVNVPDGQEVYIHHNGDYSGDAIVNVPESMWHQIIKSQDTGTMPDGSRRVEFKLPAKMMADFSRSATISEAVTALQDME